MALELGILAQVKAKLGIDSADTTRDADLALSLASAIAEILGATHLTLEATEVVDELHENVREGEGIYTQFRAVDPAVPIVAMGKMLGDTRWTTLNGVLVDSRRGRVRIFGGVGGARIWPPPAIPAIGSKFRRWRWELVSLGYSTLEPVGVDDLIGASVALAAFRNTSEGSGQTTGETVGQVAETFVAPVTGVDMPAGIAAIVGRYRFPRARLAGG